MAQRPVDVQARLTVRVPRGQQGFWEIIRDLKAFTVSDVDQRSNVARSTVRDFIVRLERGGFVARDGVDETSGHIRYRLVRDQPDAPKLKRDGSPARQRLGQDQMWRVIRMSGSGGLTATDLALTASTEDHPVKLTTAQAYLKALHRAGYLAVLRPGRPGHKPGTGSLTVYRLLPSMRTGPLAPQVQRIKAVWDPNLCRHVGQGDVEGGTP